MPPPTNHEIPTQQSKTHLNTSEGCSCANGLQPPLVLPACGGALRKVAEAHRQHAPWEQLLASGVAAPGRKPGGPVVLLVCQMLQTFWGLIPCPFFSAILLFNRICFPWVFGGFLKRRIPGKTGGKVPLETWGTVKTNFSRKKNRPLLNPPSPPINFTRRTLESSQGAKGAPIQRQPVYY